jgi:hypothetical protein
MILSLARITLAVALVSEGGQALARCVSPPIPNGPDRLKAEVRWEVDRSTAVFTGTVTAMEYGPPHSDSFAKGEMLVIRMVTDLWWKGRKSREVTVHTDNYRLPNGRMSTEAHEYRYELGRKYLVYAYADTDGGGLHANICTRTRTIEEAVGDIELLDVLTAG